jgi:hypothetical protein
MFCPNCGNVDQQENSYCRQCGIFLPDFDKISKRETTPEQQINISSTFNFLSAVASLILTVLLHISYTGKEGTPILIYVVIGFLTANFFWQVQAFWRTRQLKKQFPKRNIETELEEKQSIQTNLKKPLTTDKLLPEPDLQRVVPISVGAKTTKTLKSKIKSS